MKKLLVVVLALIVVGGGLGAYYSRRGGPEPQATTMPVTRGDVVDVVGATGTLQAVTTVQVGTQVSGTVQDLYADFNSIVKKGQIIARLDPSLIQTQIEQQRANVARSEAELERLRVSLADATRKLDQARTMWEKSLIPRDQLETAEVNVKSAEAQIRSSEAGLTQARANLNQQEVNLRHTIIRTPIDGIVISRNVDVGQTVAASMNAPTLYVIAADLTKMQVVANIDEADVGRMRPGQHVTFRVDAFPTETFTGTVEQVRLQPSVVQNVVVYSTVIDVPNRELKLKPGMTASPLSIEIARKSNVLRVPNAALRFRPTEEMFLALNQDVPPDMQRAAGRAGSGGQLGFAGAQGRGRGGQPGGGSAAGAAGAPGAAGSGAPAEPAQRGEGRGGGDQAEGNPGGRGGFDPDMSPEERRRRLEERLAGMSPEERARFAGRGRDRQGEAGQTGDAFQRGQQGAGARDISRGMAAAAGSGSAITSGATTIDSLFGPLPEVETRARAWLFADKQLRPVDLHLGVSDGTFTELIEGDLREGQELVVNLTIGREQQARPAQQGSQNPLIPQRGGGRGGPGGAGRGRG